MAITDQRSRGVGELFEDMPGWAQWPLGALIVFVVVLLIPVVVVGSLFFGWARWQGWPSSRMRYVVATLSAAWVVGLLWQAAAAGSWAAAPADLWVAIQEAFRGELSWSRTIGVFVFIELPFAAAWAWWRLARQERAMATEPKLKKVQRWKERTRRHRMRAARRRSDAEVTPLSRGSEVVVGHMYREEDRTVKLAVDQLRDRHPVWLALLIEALQRHMTLVGATGSGKTTLLRRITAGWTEAAWRQFGHTSSQELAGSGSARGGRAGRRPLTILVDCKGGRDSAIQGYEWADTMEALGLDPRRIGVFPVTDRLDMWSMPTDQLREALNALCGTSQRFYNMLQRGTLSLILDAPKVAAPTSSVEFLRRFDPNWLWHAWSGEPGRREQVKEIHSRGTLVTDMMAFDDLFRSLGTDFDGGRKLSDFDALYVSLEGTTQPQVASARAKLLVELLTYELGHGEPRDVLFVVDEWSAVSEFVDARQLVRTARGLGGSLLFCSQSYHGLGSSEPMVRELLADMAGGHLVMQGSEMEPWARICGSRKAHEVGAQLMGDDHTGMGTARLQDQWIISPDELKAMPEHHVAYIEPGACQMAAVTELPPTKRLPSSVILKAGQRLLQPAGEKASPLELEAARQDACNFVMGSAKTFTPPPGSGA